MAIPWKNKYLPMLAYRMRMYRQWVPLVVRRPGAIVYLPRWLRLADRKDAFSIDMPWLPFEAIRWLDSHIHKNMRVFEWGLGASTIYLAKRVQSIVSVEHDREWYETAGRALEAARVRNCTRILREPQPCDTSPTTSNGAPLTYRSADRKYERFHFEEYCRSIEAYEDGSLDAIFIDGRARNSCLTAAISKVRKGGFLVLDDSDRAEHSRIGESLAGWLRKDFLGPGPLTRGFWQTTVFIRP